MNCEQCQELLSAHERAELSPQIQTEVVAHLQICATCGQAHAALQQLHALLDAEIAPSPTLRQRVLTRLAAEATPPHTPTAVFGALFARLWPSRPLGAFSYSLALVLCGVFGGQLLPGAGSDLADLPAERLYQLCAVPAGPPPEIL